MYPQVRKCQGSHYFWSHLLCCPLPSYIFYDVLRYHTANIFDKVWVYERKSNKRKQGEASVKILNLLEFVSSCSKACLKTKFFYV